jgi:pimeloyl-ACP methyl ester carboxylesterase
VPTRTAINAWNATLTLDVQGQNGDQPAVLVLHSEEGPHSAQFLADGLAAHARVIAPHHPGFDRQDRILGVDRPQDIAYLYLDLLDQLGLAECALVGSSLGAWIALEMAAMDPTRFSALVAVSPLGVKFGGRLDRTFAEVLIDAPDRIRNALYLDSTRDPWIGSVDPDEVMQRAEQRESFLHYAWEPYMHNPKLLNLLPRITPPALILIGDTDRFVDAEYYPAFAKSLPNADLETVAEAGHFPDVEQPFRTLDCVQRFLATHQK